MTADAPDEALPEVAATPCVECPWRRDSAQGWLGPYPAERWLEIVHGEAPIACHVTLQESGSWEGARQCAGAAQYRTNVFKSPRNPDIATADEADDTKVFGRDHEFLAHHERRGE